LKQQLFQVVAIPIILPVALRHWNASTMPERCLPISPNPHLPGVRVRVRVRG